MNAGWSLSVPARCHNSDMTRVVHGRDSRVWTLYADLEWRSSSVSDDFEHDVSAGRGPGYVMLGLVLLLALVLIMWTPAEVNPPLWLLLLILLLVAFFPIRWSLRRPWKVDAVTGDDGTGEPSEIWSGVVRGVFRVRGELAAIAKSIERESAPPLEGPLKQVKVPARDADVVPGAEGTSGTAPTDIDDD
jgi:hypothetical protein